MIGEKVSQFRKPKNLWDTKDWSHEIQRMYWAVAELKGIVKDKVTNSLYKNVLKKWRLFVDEAIMSGRTFSPEHGGNGLQKTDMEARRHPGSFHGQHFHLGASEDAHDNANMSSKALHPAKPKPAETGVQFLATEKNAAGRKTASQGAVPRVGLLGSNKRTLTGDEPDSVHPAKRQRHPRPHLDLTSIRDNSADAVSGAHAVRTENNTTIVMVPVYTADFMEPRQFPGDPNWYCPSAECSSIRCTLKRNAVAHLQRHEKQRHENTVKFDCPAIRCHKRGDKGFSTKSNRDRHMKICKKLAAQNKREQDLALSTEEDTANDQLPDYQITKPYSMTILRHGHKHRQKIDACTEWSLETLWSALDMPVDGRLWWSQNANTLQNAKVITEEDQYGRFILWVIRGVERDRSKPVIGD